MKIGIDISQIIYEGTGVSRFTEGLVNALLEFDKKNHWLFFASLLRRSLDPQLKEKIIKRKFKLEELKIPPTVLSWLWNSLHVLKIDRYVGQFDWFITSDWTEPPSNIKKATVVHDLVYLRYPQTVDPIIRKTQEKRLKRVKEESRVVFADSEATKQDLIKFLKIPSKKIHVIYPGVDIKKPKQAQLLKVLRKYKLRPSFFILTVSKIEPRKNLKRLIQAFQGLSQNELQLVIVGPKGWENLELNRIENVKFLGYVSDSELSALYSSCLFFVYPSIWEGFGYPIVEAMKFGAPVATSNTSSLKEIGQGAALLFDPFDTGDIKNAMKKMIEDEGLRRKLSKKGKEKSKQFTWKNYYDQMIKVLEDKT